MTTEWYMDMAAAMSKRDHAITMLKRWQAKLAEAEATIAQLAPMAPQPVEQVQEPVEQEQVQ